MRGKGLFPWDVMTTLCSLTPCQRFSLVGKIIPRNILVDYCLLCNKSEHMDRSVCESGVIKPDILKVIKC